MKPAEENKRKVPHPHNMKIYHGADNTQYLWQTLRILYPDYDNILLNKT